MIRETLREFLDDDAPRLAAALSYYTVFALPPLLVLLLFAAGLFFDPAQVERFVQGQFGAMIGPQAAGEIETILANARRPGSDGAVSTLLGIGALLFGATGAFVQLQAALNTAWEVEPEGGGLKGFLMKRLLSFGMLLAIGFLLIVSLVLSAFLSAFGELVAGWLPGGLGGPALQVMNQGLSLAVFAILFAALFRYLPDAEVAWRDVWLGGAVTAGLFVLGKYLLGFYIARSSPGSAYGAAGALIVILLWVYYSSMILILGAEFTQVWARRKGRRIQPEPGAVRVVVKRTAAPAEEPGRA